MEHQGGKGADLPLDSSQTDDFCHEMLLIGSVFSGLVIDYLTFLCRQQAAKI